MFLVQRHSKGNDPEVQGYDGQGGYPVEDIQVVEVVPYGQHYQRSQGNYAHHQCNGPVEPGTEPGGETWSGHATPGRAGFKPAPTAPRYAVWGRTRESPSPRIGYGAGSQSSPVKGEGVRAPSRARYSVV